MPEAMLESPTDATIEGEQSTVDPALAELEKALAEPDKKTATPPAAAPTTETKTEVKPGEQPATQQDPLEEQLKTIEEPKVEETKPAEPQLSDSQKKILEVFPTVEKASEVVQFASGYQNFTNAFAGGNFKGVDGMLEQWNPEATEAFREHIFDKYVRNGDWVDRWIAEKEGRAEENRDVRALKGTVAKLQQQLQQRQTQETTQAQQAQQQEQFQSTVNGFVNHVEGLFNIIKATDDTDKKFIWAAVNADVSGNPALKQQILNGNYKAVNAVFKEASRTYYGKNKTAADSRAAKQAEQAGHKPPVQAGVMQEIADTVPADIKQVKKGDEDKWLDQELNKLARGRRK